MTGRSEFVGGWINTSVHDFLQEIGEPTSDMKYALVTSLDSNRDVASIFACLDDLKETFRPVGRGALVSTRDLLEADRRKRIFFGFDEVWFFPEPEVTSKPDAFLIVGPYPVEDRQIDRYSEWLTAGNCSLGLGDGTGMNYCLRARGAAQSIIQSIDAQISHSRGVERES